MKIVYLRLMLFVSSVLQRIRQAKDHGKIKRFMKEELSFTDSLLPSADRKGTVIIKCDDIGDFLVWQHVIPCISEHAERPVTFVGNLSLKPMVEAWFDFADHYVWIDKSRWNDTVYRHGMYRTVREHAPATAITTLFTRNFRMDDLLLAATGAPVRIAWDRRMHTYFPDMDQADACNTISVRSTQAVRPEFLRNAEFMENIYPCPATEGFKPLFPHFRKQKRLAVFPAANTKSRWWKAEKYASVIRGLSSEFDSIILLGGGNAVSYAARIKELAGVGNLQDLTGQTSLTDLMALIGESLVLLCPDTSAMHFAVHTRTDVVLLSNGNNWQRFAAYAPYVSSRFKVLFPPHFRPTPDKVKIHYNSAEIQAIREEDVLAAIRLSLSAWQKEPHQGE